MKKWESLAAQISRAQQLIRETRAASSKYRSKSDTQFARVFRRVVGVTPTVYGLNGHRSYYIISLFKVTYKSAIQVSRNFHALFTKTFENSDTCD